ncbi:MAG: hypothetical protein HOB18_05150 [Nitrospina sp.]|nr:hypothetical protein [Nitrospina sp.]
MVGRRKFARVLHSVFLSIFLAVPPAEAITPIDNNSAQIPVQEEVDQASKRKVIQSYEKLPLAFEINEGQSHEEVKFLSRGVGYGFFLTPTESVLVLTKRSQPSSPKSRRHQPVPNSMESESAVVRMKLKGGNPAPKMSGLDKLEGKSNYFIGNDPKKWRTDVTNFSRVKYDEVYPGIDLVYYGNQRKLEYDFIVQPGADYKTIQLDFEGAEKLAVDDKGNLVLKTAAGELIQQAPVIYQEINGQRKSIDGHYILHGNRHVGFQVAQYDTEKPLVIDPVIIFATGQFDRGLAIATVPGQVYVTGVAQSANFPTAQNVTTVSRQLNVDHMS